MKVIYKKVLKPLYPFEEGTYTHYVKYPAKIVLESNQLWEVDEIHRHKWLICDIEQLVEIINNRI